MNEWLPVILGYGFAVVVGHFCIMAVVDKLWEESGWRRPSDAKVRPAFYLPQLIGLLERALYVASLQLGEPEFIGVWLALKVAGQWKRWEEADGRIFYNIFLIGSGLSIAYAIVGFQLITFVVSERWSFAFGIPLALLIGTYALRELASYYQRQTSKT
jgi:hypothetical protein